MASILARVRDGLSVAELSALSRANLDRALLNDAELLVAAPRDEGVVLGAFQRASELGVAKPGALAVHRRGSGGGEARVGPGTVWVQLSLVSSSALVPCPPDRLINRYVRPLLRAITNSGVLAHYFERDWVSGAKRPIATIAFGHDTSTGRACIDALIAVSTPFAIRARPSMMGKEPATLAELGMKCDAATLAEAIVASYERAYGRAAVDPAMARAALSEGDFVMDPPWSSTRLEAIGLVGAGRDRQGHLRVGGELMVSRDALARLDSAITALSSTATVNEIGSVVDAVLGAPGVAFFGVRSLRSIRDVIAESLEVEIKRDEGSVSRSR